METMIPSVQDKALERRINEQSRQDSAINSAISGLLNTIGGVASAATGNPLPEMATSALGYGITRARNKHQI